MINNLAQKHSVVWAIGFRPFFLGAGVFAVLSIGQWAGIYNLGWSLQAVSFNIIQWHAHEMIYGYAMAVVAGFLLTAVTNWTGQTTSTGRSLMLMFFFWGLARTLYMFGSDYALVAGIADLAFMGQLILAITLPIVRQKLWMRMAVVSKVILLLVFNGLFVLGAQGALDGGIELGLYGGLYLLIGLILTIGKNLVPFFITRGVGYSVSITNFRWLDIASLVLFLGFFILQLSQYAPLLAGGIAGLLFAINAIRLAQWHTVGIWGKPLLWGLYVSYMFICFGFLLFALHYFADVSKFLAIHAFAVGGIGLITLSMMSRVTIGHTGRDISAPPHATRIALGLLILCAVVRVLMPLLYPGYLLNWTVLAFALWIAVFTLFVCIYAPMLMASRVDQG